MTEQLYDCVNTCDEQKEQPADKNRQMKMHLKHLRMCAGICISRTYILNKYLTQMQIKKSLVIA